MDSEIFHISVLNVFVQNVYKNPNRSRSFSTSEGKFGNQ